MGLLGRATHKDYYQSNTFGGYQFTSLDDVISQFMLAYVGEDKIISKIKKLDVAFHAQRAMQELSFDTFKSIKSYQIDVPVSLVMPLPHDYVNYTKLTWTDSAGIEHPLYPTNRTSNPFQVLQGDDGEYSFPEDVQLVANSDFSGGFVFGDPWYKSTTPSISVASGKPDPGNVAEINIVNEVLTFSHRTRDSHGIQHWGHAMAVWQEIDVSDLEYIDISATGNAVDMANGPGRLRFGVSTNLPDTNTKNIESAVFPKTHNVAEYKYNLMTKDGEVSYIEWLSTDEDDLTKELLQVNVIEHDAIYVLIISWQDFDGTKSATLTATSNIDDIAIGTTKYFLSTKAGNERESSTWNAYKGTTPSENNNDDYQDDTYWPAGGERYGLDPQHAQVNGSFFIDPRLGRIHFSSNISGKTIILDYISDSLGTDEEMQVHKFAEEAVYKSILCGVMSAKANVGRNQLVYYKKDKFAAIRTAKLRLSNIKLEELTQILRGKSKHIKH